MTTIASPYFMGDRMHEFAVPMPHTTLVPDFPDGDAQHRMASLYGYLATLVASIEDPVVYAGDCVSIIGVLAGLARRDVHPTLVFFDAHGDFHTWDTTPSQFIGGMPLAMVTGRGEQTIMEGAGLTPLPDDRIVLVDARDLDPGEDTAVDASAITVTSTESVMDAIPSDGPLYVHVDLDVVDPSEMPAMNYPAPGGPSLATVAEAVAALAGTGRVVAFSLSSWNPALPGAHLAAEGAATIAAPFLNP